MQAPALYKSQNLGHLGLVAGLYDELGIGALIDTIIPQDLERRDVSIGLAIKAMVINGLGFAQNAFYLTPHFFNDMPPNIKAEQLNDTTLSRAMDSIYEHGISEIFSQISTKTGRLLGLDCRIRRLLGKKYKKLYLGSD